jgi:hypothetical protein
MRSGSGGALAVVAGLAAPPSNSGFDPVDRVDQKRQRSQAASDKQLSMLRVPAREIAAPCGYGVARSGDRQGSTWRVCVRAVVNEHRRGWGDHVLTQDEERGDGAHGPRLDLVGVHSGGQVRPQSVSAVRRTCATRSGLDDVRTANVPLRAGATAERDRGAAAAARRVRPMQHLADVFGLPVRRVSAARASAGRAGTWPDLTRGCRRPRGALGRAISESRAAAQGGRGRLLAGLTG